MGHTVPCSPRSPSRKPDLLAERRLELQLWSGGRGAGGTTSHHTPLSCAWDQQMAWSPGPQGGRVSPSTPGPWAVLSVCWFNSSSKLWRPHGASQRGKLEEGVCLWPWLQKPLAPWVMISSSPWPLVGTAVSHTWIPPAPGAGLGRHEAVGRNQKTGASRGHCGAGGDRTLDSCPM